ncbi:MAG: Xaa-Pro peptidase family protein [Candidatus Lokiarchaeota archaeon]
MSKKPKSIKTPPKKEELSNRLNKVRKLMLKNNFDYYISFDPTNIYYLTNFAFYIHERPFILVIPKEGIPKFIVPLLEKSHVQERAIIEMDLISYYEFPAPEGKNWFDQYRTIFKKGKKVGVESTLPLEIYEKTPGKKFINDIIDKVRLIKTDYEVGRLVHASKIVNRGHRKLLKICKPGVAEFAIYKEVTNTMTSKIIQEIPNANFKATETTGAVWPPSFSHEPHIVPNIFAKMEEGGPHVSIVSARVDGYGVELERTFFLGDIPKETIKPFNVMYEAREIAYKMAKPGVLMSEIDKEVKKYIINSGYGEYIIHRTGHGLGITGHEAPYLAEGYNEKLAPNMVISIEPGIYIPKIGGFRHSDTVLIIKDGNIKLTQAPETLEEVKIEI